MNAICKVAILGGTGYIGKNMLNSIGDSYSLSARNNFSNFDEKTDVIVNLIGKVKSKNAKEFEVANVEVLKKVFKKFLVSDAQLLIHISTIGVIEELYSEEVITENSPYNPNSLYGISKAKGEKWLIDKIPSLPIDKKVIILRPPMIYGENAEGNLKLLYQIISKGLPYPFAKFHNKRSFISVNNLSYLITKVIENRNLDNLSSGVYNISDDESLSTIEIVRMIAMILDKKPILLPLPISLINYITFIGDRLNLALNSNNVKKLTGDLVVDNNKIKTALGIEKLPYIASVELQKCILSYKRLEVIND
jgi:nucleoside-diphosphate-sugar epimerase